MSNSQNKYPYKEKGDRLIKIRGKRSKQEVADFLDISLRTLYRYETGERDPGPYLKIMGIAQQTIFKEAGFVKDPKEDYRLHGDPPLFSWESFCEVPGGLDFPKTIDLLADIFRSKDEEAINAVKSNISQIARGIELDSKLVALAERMDEAEKNIS